jgi:hypothetical protein
VHQAKRFRFEFANGSVCTGRGRQEHKWPERAKVGDRKSDLKKGQCQLCDKKAIQSLSDRALWEPWVPSPTL